MPRISKIRLTGCKYDGLRKEHEDSIFDLTKDETPDHTLFTLCNGGGKGVMMQLIFQLLLPNTRWGKNDGNKIISMFYDQRNNLHPYTFHVVLEWVLDTVPERRLITGIAVKAIIKNTNIDEEERTGLSYYLYTYEHDNNGYFTVENLPLLDKKTGEAVDFDIFEQFLYDNRRDFVKYSGSSVRRKDGEYYRYLESRGIYRAEWLNLKAMNKSEGGVGDYFIGASDNKSVFDKIIIPAISENLRNYTLDDEDNLIQMFKSNLSITKDLPVLIKREGDYKELLIEIEPLIQNADSGSRFIHLRDRLIDEGNDIYYILKDEDSIITENINKWSREEEKAKEEKKELEFKKDNLNYNIIKKELELKEKEIEKLHILFEEKNQALDEKKEELISYEINEVLNYKRETETEISNKIMERKHLVEALDISDIEERIKELDNEIDIEWGKIKKIWNNNENQFNGFLNYCTGIREESLNKIKKYRDIKEKFQIEINKFELKEENLAKKKEKLKEDYDPMALMFPERILEDLISSKENTERSINSLIEEKELLNNHLSIIKDDLNKHEYSLNDKEDNFKTIKEEILRKEKNELELAKKVSAQLLESYDGSLLNHNWFENKLNMLDDMKNKKQDKLEEIQRTIWEKNIDILLNKENYFIPNKDIALIKERIKSIGVHAETGPEYLMNLPKSEREDILRKHPGFLYSVVIGSKRDWELIDKNINKDLFLNSMVPIYIRSAMNVIDNSFNLILGKAYGLAEEEGYISWKNNLAGEFQNLTNIERSIRKDIKDIDELVGELAVIRKIDTAYTLTKKLKELEKEILEVNDIIRSLGEEKLNTSNKLYLLDTDINNNKNRLNNTNTSISKIKSYIEDVEEIQGDRLRILETKEKLNETNVEIINLEDYIATIKDNEYRIRISYNEWKEKTKTILAEIKSIYKDIEYNPMINNDYKNHNIPDFTIGNDFIEMLLKERRILEEDITSRNIQIAVIDEGLNGLNKALDRHFKDLDRIHVNWDKYPILQLSTDEIMINIDKCKMDIKSLETESKNIKSTFDSISGSIGEIRKSLLNTENQIKKDHKRPPIIISIDDIHSEINMVDRNLKSNKDYLSLCIEEININNKISSKLQINIIRIKDSYGLDFTKGKMNKVLKEKIQYNADIVVDNWISGISKNEIDIKKTIDEGERYRSQFIRKVSNRLEEDKLKEQILSAVKEANISNFKNNIISFSSMKNHFHQEILTLSKDKEKAESAMKQWTDRASIYIIRMVESLKVMVSSMNYTNEQGYIFPLVKLKGVERLPKEESEILYLLEEYFVQTISQILERNQDIDKIEDRVFNELMGDKAIFSKALQGRYPTLLVYKMSEKNEFKFARARDEYYTTWEAINKGEGDLPEGSGGQTLSVNTFVVMMIMSFKKKHMGNENPSTVLILDNPFGKASAKHVLDPIFEIADKLNFQLICFAAPEIIKMEISERFPIFWELKIEEGKIVHGGRIIK